ncbi:MAG: radical SAM protein [Candidatus Altiarchaeota archaeon]
MRKIVDTQYSSKRIGKLPEGCRRCVKGEKLVLFVTGLCPRRCWYCPLSEKKKNKDVVYANERPTRKRNEIVEEAKLISATGAGFTGGDPLVKINRTISYLKLLKNEFGDGFHIHLYTSGRGATPQNLRQLYKAGLDEIRFHPAKKDWDKIKKALEFDWSVGAEIPVLPKEIEKTKDFIRYLDEIGVDFLNLNEFETSYTNVTAVERKGYKTRDDLSFSILGVEKAANDLLKFCAKETNLRVHYCTVTLKDRFQVGNRLKRAAKNVSKEFDVITKEGLLIRGAIYLEELKPSFGFNEKIEKLTPQKKKQLLQILQKNKTLLQREYDIPPELLFVDEKKLRILTSIQVVEELEKELKEKGLTPTIVEEYPTWDQLTVDLQLL